MKKVKLLALIAALATAFGIYFLILSLSKPVVVPERKVLVAAVDIAENTVIKEDMVKVETLPVKAILSGSMSDASLVVGKMLNTKVVSGQQILSSQLASTGDVGEDTLAYSVKKGMRAITIGVDSTSGLDGMINAGDSVDLVAMLKYKKNSDTVPTSVLLFQDITVLAVDQDMSTSSGGNSYKTITLQVTPEQAVKICYTEDTASIRAILRSPLDHDTSSVPSVTLGNLN